MARISQQQKRVVRAKLLASAAQHFAERGLGGANINQISLDAGYAKGTVYNYFDSKEQLFATVLALGTDETVRRYRSRAVEGSARAHLLAIAEEDARLVREHEAFMRTLLREMMSPLPSTRVLVEASLRPLIEEVTAVLRAGQAAEEIDAHRPAEELAQVFLSALAMAYVQNWSTEGQAPSWEELPEWVVSLFLDGARAR
ncbi:MAG: TetR/AcrR family transcriptional regulator [Proteobacteria bacterium]|nr:TetR/AcrR family transcriptional regulator [Pseudomonadota bacterium]